MARDAIARQYDVEKNSVQLNPEPGEPRYQPGTITFQAKKGKSIALDQIQASLRATRLSGNTQMGMNYLEITAAGEVVAVGNELRLQVPGTRQQFVLSDAPGDRPKEDAKTLLQLREALDKGQKLFTVTGRVQGWSGRFPEVLRALEEASAREKLPVLAVTDFRTGKE